MINGQTFDSLNDLVAKLNSDPDAFSFDSPDGPGTATSTSF